MYDFYFGSDDDIAQDPATWLLTIKRMLPRWPNGIPDSEFLALYDLLSAVEGTEPPIAQRPVLVETGSGASTIVLLFFAVRWNTELFTWDTSGSKLAYLRGVLNDTLFRYYRDHNIFAHWKYVAYSSISPYAGLHILTESERKASACFLDSDHTWENLGAELEVLCPVLAPGALVAIDDGNYRYRQVNAAYVNMIRTKLGLPVVDIPDNECPPFWEMTEALLRKHFPRVQNLNGGTYRDSYHDDIFWNYYSADRHNMSRLGMEKTDELLHRFDAWRVDY